ncbi:expressed unknown protein [Seminavis robusta]|uniref:Transmembrane protein n=1 Tax=Seminavis robusta TaxID=568900 RepID=A0A9N8H9E5_9STRA|nr:expressed unknown protein [Seminavis robusta]|eukprot:Sro251_g099430.1 n/a (252) ;mRNA; f:79415-80170
MMKLLLVSLLALLWLGNVIADDALTHQATTVGNVQQPTLLRAHGKRVPISDDDLTPITPVSTDDESSDPQTESGDDGIIPQQPSRDNYSGDDVTPEHPSEETDYSDDDTDDIIPEDAEETDGEFKPKHGASDLYLFLFGGCAVASFFAAMAMWTVAFHPPTSSEYQQVRFYHRQGFVEHTAGILRHLLESASGRNGPPPPRRSSSPPPEMFFPPIPQPDGGLEYHGDMAVPLMEEPPMMELESSFDLYRIS